MRMLALTSRNFKEIARDPMSVSMGLAMPVLFLIPFSALSKRVPMDIFTPLMLTPGMIVFSYAFIMMFSAMLLSRDRQTAFLDRLLTSPLKTTEFIWAYIIPFMPIALLQFAVCFIAGLLMGLPFSWTIFSTLIVLFPLSIACSGLGMIMGSLLTQTQVSAVGSILITAMSLFSGAWMDLKMIGGAFKSIGYAMPFAHAVDASRALLKGGSLASIVPDLIWVLAYAVVMFAGGALSFRYRTKL